MTAFADFASPRYLKNNKIRVILDENNMNASQFADAIQVQRSTISHILAYRNRPSQDVLERIVKWNEKYSFDWFRTESEEEAEKIKQLIEKQGYGGSKLQQTTAPESREKNLQHKPMATNDSKAVATSVQPSAMTPTETNKPRRAVVITILYDDGSSQLIHVDPNSRFNQLVGS
ncbi:MAG: helix-turn-helix domain-containing protein [Runella sp.]